MLLLSLKKWSFDADLQIIHADVKLIIEGQILIDEPLCIDVGLPALLLSACEATEPNRWASHLEWQRMPFFVCGCGDAECRGFSFVVKHVDETWTNGSMIIIESLENIWFWLRNIGSRWRL
jgi:hypothetical protein